MDASFHRTGIGQPGRTEGVTSQRLLASSERRRAGIPRTGKLADPPALAPSRHLQSSDWNDDGLMRRWSWRRLGFVWGRYCFRMDEMGDTLETWFEPSPSEGKRRR